jgi:hypothetical protein
VRSGRRWPNWLDEVSSSSGEGDGSEPSVGGGEISSDVRRGIWYRI